MTSGPEPADDDAAGAPAAAAGWPAPLLEALGGDRRIVGAAEAAGPGAAGGVRALASVRALLVVTTWDGRDAVAADLPRLGALALGGPPEIARHGATTWSGLGADRRRVDLEVVRIGDLKPSARGEDAAAVADTHGLIAQWIRWSSGRDRTRDLRGDDDAPPGRGHDRAARDRAARLLEIESGIRFHEDLPAGSTMLHGDGERSAMRPLLAAHMRSARSELLRDVPAEAALLARIDAALAAAPLAGAGLRVVPGEAGPAAALESFLAVADGEGFLGDRVLFAEAAKRLSELSRRTPVFDEGFVLPTFDAVEARWRIGEAKGECRTPLVPGIHVGVGVTPSDHLEFWAAPCVREPLATVACVADAGSRVVRERTTGKDALVAACVGQVERAWYALPEFLRTARRAGRVPAGDVEQTLRPLHLPRSYREAARRGIGRLPTPTRLQVAMALARAGEDQEPLHARKLGLAAGRFLAETPAAGATAPPRD